MSNEGSFVEALKATFDRGIQDMYKDLARMYDPWSGVDGANKELISRIQALSPVEKALLGIDDDSA